MEITSHRIGLSKLLRRRNLIWLGKIPYRYGRSKYYELMKHFSQVFVRVQETLGKTFNSKKFTDIIISQVINQEIVMFYVLTIVRAIVMSVRSISTIECRRETFKLGGQGWHEDLFRNVCSLFKVSRATETHTEAA